MTLWGEIVCDVPYPLIWYRRRLKFWSCCWDEKFLLLSAVALAAFTIASTRNARWTLNKVTVPLPFLLPRSCISLLFLLLPGDEGVCTGTCRNAAVSTAFSILILVPKAVPLIHLWFGWRASKSSVVKWKIYPLGKRAARFCFRLNGMNLWE